MRIVNMHEAKTHLARLVDEAAASESFIIAYAGKPLVKVTVPQAHLPRAGAESASLAGQISVPPDFDRIGSEEIAREFEIPVTREGHPGR